MKRFLTTISLLISIACYSTNYYVATTGSDANPGTIGSPYLTWEKGASALVAGDTCFIRGGSYSSPKSPGASDWLVTISNRTGTSVNPVVITAYPGEQPVLDLNAFDQTNNTTVMRINHCSWVVFHGLWVKNMKQNTSTGSIVAGWEFHECTDIVMDACWVDNLGGAGINQSVKNGGDVIDNARFVYVNCDASRCGDSISTGGGSYGNADGFDCKLGTATYINCRAWWNSDDGFDCFNNDSLVTFQGCWSFRNGYKPGTFTDPGSQADGMGFKWGTTLTDQRTVHERNYINCLSFDNKAWGFDQNVARCIAWFYNNTAFRNVAGGWATGYSLSPRVASVLVNNVSLSNPVTVSDFSGLTENHNTWDGAVTCNSSDFVSTDTTGVGGLRSNGTLPPLNFMKLIAGSDLIDAGIADTDFGFLGMTYSGSAPDMGAYEFISAYNRKALFFKR